MTERATTRVFLLDDQVIVAEAVQSMIAEESDFEFLSCVDPSMALEKIKNFGPTVILLDLVMPRIDGLTILRLLRRHPDTKEVPVIVLSGKNEALQKAEAFACKANDYLVKLPQKVELLARLRYHSQAYLNLKTIQQSMDSLRSLNTKLENANLAKSRFLANVSHEIRTPMNGILGMAQIMLSGKLSSGQKHRVETIKSSAEALLALINDILDFSKIEAGRLELVPSRFYLPQIIYEVLHLFVSRAEEKGVRLSFFLDEGCEAHFKADAVRLRQVLTNLVGNAVKFTESGSVSVVVSRSEEQNLYRFEVQDTGIGLPKGAEKKIFTAFTQADLSDRRAEGTGLGLTIARRLVDLMGGEIACQSEPGEGSLFYFTAELQRDSETELPFGQGQTLLLVDPETKGPGLLSRQLRSWGFDVKVASSAKEAKKIARVDSPDILLIDSEVKGLNKLEAPQVISIGHAGHLSDSLSKPPDLSKLRSLLSREEVKEDKVAQERYSARVLLVEDNLVNQEVGREMLEILGCGVEVANDGKEGLELALSSTFDLILMDCEMPIMDGLEAATKIREAEKARTPIVALTAHALSSQKENCLKAGMDDFICKPLQLEELQKVLAQWTDQA